MRSRLLLVLLLLLTTACTKDDDSAAKLDSNSGPAAAEIAAANKKAAEEAEIAEAAATKKAKEEAEIAEAAATKKAKEEAEMAEAARLKAESEAATKRLADATENYKVLNDELSAATKAYTAARRKVKSREESIKFSRENPNPFVKLGPQFADFAKEYAGTKEAVEAMVILATRGSGESKTEAINLMIKDHVDHDKIATLVSSMVRTMPSPQNEKWIDQVIENTTVPTIEGKALVAKAGMLDRIDTYKGFWASADERVLESVDKDILEFVNAERDANERTDLVDLMEAFVKNNSEEASIVERVLYGLKYLSVNCVAPDITGIDLDDKDFNLSDYRGKVVFLDFWGDW